MQVCVCKRERGTGTKSCVMQIRFCTFVMLRTCTMLYPSQNMYHREIERIRTAFIIMFKLLAFWM